MEMFEKSQWNQQDEPSAFIAPGPAFFHRVLVIETGPLSGSLIMPQGEVRPRAWMLSALVLNAHAALGMCC